MIAMKKYLIKGALALFATGLFFSCAEKESEYVPVAQQKVKAFEDVFREVYGDNIDPYQKWGFSDRMIVANGDSVEETIIEDDVVPTRSFRAGTRGAGTRGAYPNGNEWCKTYDVPYALTEHQKDIVRQYFQQVKDPTDVRLSFTNFFVQDVYKGGTNTLGALTTESYTSAYGSTFYGSNQMDRLTCAGKNGVGNEHINNYNNAQCSSRSDIKHTGDYVDGYTPYTRDNYDKDKGWENCEVENFNHLKQYTDKIMLMEDCSTDYFGYQNSLQSSNRYNDMFKRVSGSEIMRWARLNNKTIYGDSDVSGMYFVGFDYEADLSHGLTDIYQGNSYLVTEVDENTPGAFQVPNKNDGKWYIAGARDHYYSDWIIRIVPGDKIPQHEYGEGSRENIWDDVKDEWDQVISQSGRIFCEDLGKAGREDLDYNDAVFDVIIWEHTHTVQPMISTTTWTTTDNEIDPGSEKTSEPVTNGDPVITKTYYAQIELLAAGGTIPLTVAGEEVHNAFGVAVVTMVNTRDGNSTAFGSYEAKDPVFIGNIDKTVFFNGQTYNLKLVEGIQHAKDVQIVSSYDGSQVLELSADGAKAPHKLFVPFGTIWASERRPLNMAYPEFGNYVSDASKVWVNNYNSSYLYTAPAQGLNVMPSVMKTKRASNSETADILSTQTYTYQSWSLNNISLNIDQFKVGDRLRFYGSGINANSHITVVFSDGSQPYLIDTDFATPDGNGNYPSVACVEVLLDQLSCDKLNSSKVVQVQGRDFTLTQITRVP